MRFGSSREMSPAGRARRFSWIGLGCWLSCAATDGSFATADGVAQPDAPAPVGRDGGVGTYGLADADGSGAGAGSGEASDVVSAPGGEAGAGFDDLRYSADLDRVLVPGGGTGTVLLVQPDTLATQVITGFSRVGGYHGGHDDGPTSADEGRGLLFVSDRTARSVVVVDPASGARLAEAPLTAEPDYVRYLSATSELWVTEPSQERIEVLSLPDGAAPVPAFDAFIEVPGGPESLVVDPARGQAYTHLWAGQTVAIDLASRRIVGQWSNGCSGSRGIALDGPRGLLFAGCSEGRATVMSLDQGGALVDDSDGGGLRGVDVIGYDAGRHHLYVAGGNSRTLAIIQVSEAGDLTLLGTVPTASGARCVVADEHGHAFWCDPSAGVVHRLVDPY